MTCASKSRLNYKTADQHTAEVKNRHRRVITKHQPPRNIPDQIGLGKGSEQQQRHGKVVDEICQTVCMVTGKIPEAGGEITEQSNPEYRHRDFKDDIHGVGGLICSTPSKKGGGSDLQEVLSG